jgi:hypothetical protein
MTKKNGTNAARNTNPGWNSPLTQAVFATIEPVVRALDSDTRLDNGHDTPSMTDRNLEFLLNGTITSLYLAARGDRTGTDGRRFDNATDMVNRSDEQIARFCRRYADNPEGMESDPQFAIALYWKEVNYARLHMLNDLLDAYRAVWQHIYRKPWEYKPFQRKATPVSARSKMAAELEAWKASQVAESKERVSAIDAATA